MTGSDTSPPINPKPAKPSRQNRNWRQIAAYGFGGAVLGIIGVIAVAGTGPVLRMATPMLNQAVSAVTDSEFTLGKIEGSLWTGLTLDQVTMDRATDGFHLALGDIEFEWSPTALLAGKLEVNRLGLASVNVILPDDAAPETAETEDATGGGFAMPLSVSLDMLELGDVAILDPITGNSFFYTLQGRAKIGKNLSASAFLDLEPRDGGKDRIKLDLDFDGPKQRLTAEIDGTLDREGLVMTLAGVDPANATDVRIALNGDGPAHNWQGVLDLSAAGYASLASAIGVQLSSDVATFTLDGSISPQERISEQLPEILNKDVALSIGGAFDQSEQTLAFERLSIAMADGFSLSGTAELDLADNLMAADFGAEIDSALSRLFDDTVSWAELGLSIKANGDMTMPGMALRVDGRDVQTPMSRIANIGLQADMMAPDDEDAPFAATLGLSVSGTQWDNPDVAAFLGAAQDLTLDTRISPDFGDISVRNLVLNMPDMTLHGQANVTDGLNVTASNLVADIRDLAIFAPISGLDLGGRGQIALPDLKWSDAGGLETGIDVSARQAGFGLADLDRIIGPEPRITGKVTLAPDFDLTVDIAAIDAATVDGPLMLRITEVFEKISLQSALDIASGVVPPDLGIDMAPATLRVDIEGDLAIPAGMFDLRTPSLAVSGQKISEIVLTSQMAWSDQLVLSLANKGRFSFANRPYQLDANLSLPTDALLVEAISLRGEHIELSGDIALPDYNLPMRGDIALSKFNAVFLEQFGLGFVDGGVTAKVALRPDNQGQNVAANASARGLRLVSADGADPTMIEDVKLTTTIENAFKTPDIKAALEAGDITAGDIALETMALDVEGGFDALAIRSKTAGLYRGSVPLETDLAAELSLGRDRMVRASRLDTIIGDQAIGLRKPLEFSLSEDGRQQLDADLFVGTGQLFARLDQQAGQKSISAEVKLNDVELGPWGRIVGFDGLSGLANLDANLQETRGNLPIASVDGRISGIRAKAVSDLKPFEMLFDVALADGKLVGKATLGNDDLDMLTASGNLPFGLSVLKQQFSPDLGAPVSASLRLNGEIAEFWPYVPAPDHQMSGMIKLALDVGGTLDDVRWDGNVSLDDGRYENFEYGTILDQIALKGTFDQAGLVIPSITATDGGKGTVNASVDLDLGNGGDIRYDVSADLRNVALSRKDELQFWADVKASVTGSQSEADIQSTVTVQRGEVDLSLALPESVPTIEIQNLPAASDSETADENGGAGNAFTGNLNVTVDIPGRLFVRGKGLDSEWGGRLEISGTTDDPRVSGQLSALRGQLDVIGKTFVIRDSRITFAGASPPDPTLDIKGVYTTADLVVTAGFQGPSSDPELVLSSTPSLPEDEILSQVLFGKSQGNLSAVEAVQLASALNELSGGGSGLDVVGSIRRFIGADVLRVGGGESGPEVKVGKYLTEGVYVGTKAGSTPGSSGVEVEIEVTPNISVTSETTEIDSKAGVQYHLDY